MKPKGGKPENRLLQWGNQKERNNRNKVIEKELDIIHLTRSLSKQSI